MSISNTLAVLMGGEIQVSSEPGVGSEFVLRLPLESGLETQAQRRISDSFPASDGPRLAGIRVLVADDVRINRTIMEALLEAEGALVTMVANGLEAVDAVSGREDAVFDAVLMDLQMPEMDGRRATRRIRAAHPAIPVIGLTAHASDEEREKSLASGMDDQLVKPVFQDELVATILHCIAKSQYGLSGEAVVS